MTIRKGQREIEQGESIIDNFAGRGRKSVESRLPQLLADIETIAGEQSQTDPTFRTTRLYTRLTVRAMRQQLIVQKGYSEADLPSDEALRVRMNR